MALLIVCGQVSRGSFQLISNLKIVLTIKIKKNIEASSQILPLSSLNLSFAIEIPKMFIFSERSIRKNIKSISYPTSKLILQVTYNVLLLHSKKNKNKKRFFRNEVIRDAQKVFK